MSILVVALLGFFTGLRTMTPIAVLCWYAYTQHLALTGWRSFAASLIAVIIFTAGALGEYIGDKLPKTPSRTSPLGLVARSIFGILVAVIIAQPLHLSLPVAVILGAVGALAGSFIGYFVRTRSVLLLDKPDWTVAVLEDVIAIAGSILTFNILESIGTLIASH